MNVIVYIIIIWVITCKHKQKQKPEIERDFYLTWNILHVGTKCNLIQISWGRSWSWSHGSWIYNYLFNRCLSQCSKFPVVRSSMTTKNDYGRPEFVAKLSEWRPEIFFYPDAEIYSFQVLCVDFPKLPLKMAINIKLFK